MRATVYPDYEQAVLDLLKEGATPGKLITHAWLNQHLRLDVRAPDYEWKKLQGTVSFRQKLLVDHKIHLSSVRGKGYVLVAPENQTNVAVNEASTIIGKTIKTTVTRLTNVALEQLSDAKKKENTDALARMAALGGMTIKQIES